MTRDAVQSPRDTDADPRLALCIYLIAEDRKGATIGELARLELGGRPATEELSREDTHRATSASGGWRPRRATKAGWQLASL